jgi:NRPS condensation-like uncharacterized protein
MSLSAPPVESGPTAGRTLATPGDLAIYLWQRCGEMIIQMELGFTGQLDRLRLARAAHLLLDAEPILGCRLVLEPQRPYWEPVPGDERQGLTVVSSEAEYAEVRCRGLQATGGVQLTLCLWPRPAGDRLLVKMTHEVGDGFTLKTAIVRLAAIYSALAIDPTYRPSAAPPTSREFSQVLANLSWYAIPRAIWDFIRFVVPRWFPRHTQTLALPTTAELPWVPIVRSIAAPAVTALSAYGRARHASVNDVLLAGAYRALATESRWDRSAGLRIIISVDLRRWYLPAGQPLPLGNLASVDWPFLMQDLGETFDDTLARVNRLMQRRKRSGLGLAQAVIGHYLIKDRSYESLARADARQMQRQNGASRRSLNFSNEGALDSLNLDFGGQLPTTAHVLPPFIHVPGVHVCVSSYRGALTFATVTSSNGAAAIARFIETWIAELSVTGLDRRAPEAAAGYEPPVPVV